MNFLSTVCTCSHSHVIAFLPSPQPTIASFESLNAQTASYLNSFSSQHIVCHYSSIDKGLLPPLQSQRRFFLAPHSLAFNTLDLSRHSLTCLQSMENSAAVLCKLAWFFLCHSTMEILNLMVYEFLRGDVILSSATIESLFTSVVTFYFTKVPDLIVN